MLVLGIQYLNGWVMATHPAERERPEWPPHPDRLFMALVAAHFETGGDAAERQVLEWLETLPPPQLVCCPESRDRDTLTTFVPVNDSGDPIKKNRPLMPAGSLPLGRDRQPRQFPVTIPDDPRVFLLWTDASPSDDQRHQLAQLAAKVTYLGHSASLVQLWLADSLPAPEQQEPQPHCRLVPSQTATRYRLRVPGPGRLAGLEQRYNAAAVAEFAELQAQIAASRGKAKKQLQQQLADRFGDAQPQVLRPSPGLWMGYAPAPSEPPAPPPPHSHFDSELIVLRQVADPRGRRQRFGIESTLLLTEALRGTAMQACPVQPPPEWLSGHAADGRPSQRERGHVAFLPLPHVGRLHADGRLLGLAIAVPRDVPADEWSCLHSLLFDQLGKPRDIRLVLGAAGECMLRLEDAGPRDSRVALDPRTWTRASSRWATVTPIALDRHAKSATPWIEIEASIADACQRIGLPRPREVVSSPVSLFPGAAAARQMPRIVRKKAGGQIRHCHAILIFPQPVEGPVLLGAGRYRGYGLCRPLDERPAAFESED